MHMHMRTSLESGNVQGEMHDVLESREDERLRPCTEEPKNIHEGKGDSGRQRVVRAICCSSPPRGRSP